MAARKTTRGASQVYAVRVGPADPPDGPAKRRYIVGWRYPAKPVKERIGAVLREVDALDGASYGVVVAAQAIAIIGKGPGVYGWPNNEAGLAAARDTAKRVPDATVVRVRDARGPR